MLQHFRSAPLLHHLRPNLSSFSLRPSKYLLNLPISFNPSNQLKRTTRSLCTATKEQFVNGDSESYFFAPDEISWKSLGISDSVSQALSNCGLHKPSLVQAACIPHIMTDKDVVIAAETGSGKTHGYLAPLIDKLCTISNLNPKEEDNLNEKSSKKNLILVLCPNVMLSEQVVNMANSLLSPSGEPILKVSAVCGQKGWPIVQPDVIVSTPAALLNYLCEYDPERRRRERFLRHVKFVVFDEADMLLCGSFQNQVIRLIHMLRFDEKLLSKLNGPHTPTESEKNLPEEDVTESESSEEDLLEEEEDGSATDENLLEGEEEEDESVTESATEGSRRSWGDWRRVRKVYERSKQYVFVAATLPQSGKKTAGGVLKKMFPEAVWISGAHLHRHNPRLEQRWIEVTTDTQVDALLEAINYSNNNNNNNNDNSTTRTMVFANTVDSANAIYDILEKVGIKCILYHKEGSLEERADSIIQFRQNGGIFVCTDAAARGLDIPNISHVIQAEFASCAVDFLHRVGRTARAGQSGVVTNLYTRSNRDLVDAVRRAEETNLPVENAFSRKRSFRNKLKKRGRASMTDKPKVVSIV